MQNITYNNLSSRFTINTIWSLLTKFWISEVISQKEYSKIWLTIIVNNSQNKSFTLINNLPFSTNGYTDVLIVLRQVFKTSLFYDRDVLNNIVFIYHLECKDYYKNDLYIRNMFIYIILTLIILILILCTWIMFLDIYQIYNIENIDKEVFNYATEKIKHSHSKEFTCEAEINTKRFLFSPFIELLNGNTTNFPSKFVDINSNDLNELKSLLNNQNVMPNQGTSLMKTMSTLNNRIQEYESLVYDLVEIIRRNHLSIE